MGRLDCTEVLPHLKQCRQYPSPAYKYKQNIEGGDVVQDNVAVVQIFVGTERSPSFVPVQALVGTPVLSLVVAGGKTAFNLFRVKRGQRGCKH